MIFLAIAHLMRVQVRGRFQRASRIRAEKARIPAFAEMTPRIDVTGDEVLRTIVLKFSAAGMAAKHSALADEELAHQGFPFVDLVFELFRRVFTFEVEFFELLLQRTNIVARRAETAFHGDLLAEF